MGRKVQSYVPDIGLGMCDDYIKKLYSWQKYVCGACASESVVHHGAGRISVISRSRNECDVTLIASPPVRCPLPANNHLVRAAVLALRTLLDLIFPLFCRSLCCHAGLGSSPTDADTRVTVLADKSPRSMMDNRL